MKHTDIWYRNRLSKYFIEKYGDYEWTASFYTNSAPNEWLFIIPELCSKIKLICHDDGQVIEKRVLV